MLLRYMLDSRHDVRCVIEDVMYHAHRLHNMYAHITYTFFGLKTTVFIHVYVSKVEYTAPFPNTHKDHTPLGPPNPSLMQNNAKFHSAPGKSPQLRGCCLHPVNEEGDYV